MLVVHFLWKGPTIALMNNVVALLFLPLEDVETLFTIRQGLIVMLRTIFTLTPGQKTLDNVVNYRGSPHVTK